MVEAGKKWEKIIWTWMEKEYLQKSKQTPNDTMYFPRFLTPEFRNAIVVQ